MTEQDGSTIASGDTVIWRSAVSPAHLSGRDVPGGLFEVTRWELADGNLTVWWAALPARPATATDTTGP